MGDRRFGSAAIGALCVAAALTACSDSSSTSGDSAGGRAPAPAQAESNDLPRRAGAPHLLLPNLRSLPAEDVQIRRTENGGRELRFGAVLANVGDGPLIVVPDTGGDCPPEQRHAAQSVIGDADGDQRYDTEIDPPAKTVPAGCMLDHPTHDHWHFDASASYVLTRPGRAARIAATDKVSFCLRDSRRLPGSQWPGASQRYDDCDRTSVQGITAGFADDYDVETPGQSLPLADGLPDGIYCLTLRADPANLLRETDDTDNAAVSAVRINGTQAAGAPPTACERSP